MQINVSVGKGSKFPVEVPGRSNVADGAQLSNVNVSSKVYAAKVDNAPIAVEDWSKTFLRVGQHVHFYWAPPKGK